MRPAIEVGRFSLGAAPLGNLYSVVSDDDARATVDAAWELGVRTFDTAPLYGHGLSETRLGAALRDRPRDEYVLASKVGRVLVPDGSGGPDGPTIFEDTPPAHPVFDFSHDGVLRSVEASLMRLGHDRVDLLHVHDPDDHVADALAGAFPTLVRLRDEGVVRAIGVGLNQAPLAARLVREVDLDWVLLAGRYTLLDQSALDDLLPTCREQGVTVMAAGVFNSGLLADPRPGATYDYAPASAERLDQARRLAAVCDRHGVPLAAAALQLPLGHPAVATVLVGARSAEEVRVDHELLSLPIPDDLWAELQADGLLRPDVPHPPS